MEALGLNFVDWTIIVVITASVVLSIIRGFVKEFLSLFIWVIAFFAVYLWMASLPCGWKRW